MNTFLSIVLSLLAGVAGAFSYGLYQKNMGSPEFVVLNTEAIYQQIVEGEASMSPKELADAIQARADSLAEDGKIVLRNEMIWSVPDRYEVVVQE